MNRFNLITLISGSVIAGSSSLVSSVVGLKGKDSISYHSTYREEAKDYTLQLLRLFTKKPLLLYLKGFKKDRYSLAITNSVIQTKLRQAISLQYFKDELDGGEVTKKQMNNVRFSPLKNKKGKIIGKTAFPTDSSPIMLSTYYLGQKVDIRVIGLFSSLSHIIDNGGSVYNMRESDLTGLTEKKKGGELKLKNTKEAHTAFRKVLFNTILSQNKKVTLEMLNLLYFGDFKTLAFRYYFFLHRGRLSHVGGTFYGEEEIIIYLKILPADGTERKINYYLFGHFNPLVSNDYLTIPFVSNKWLPASDPRIAREIRIALYNYSRSRGDGVISAVIAKRITFKIISGRGYNMIAASDHRTYNIIIVFDGVEFPIRVKEKESHQVIPWTDLTPAKPIGQEVYETLEWRLKKFDRKHPFVATVAPDWSTLWDASIDSKRGQKYLQANMSKDWILCSYRLKFAGLDGWIGFTTGKLMHLNVIYAVTPTSHREYHDFWFLIK